ncbi:hypothetical protein TNCV_1645061 [Trichonephila clavipes]|nr:hypothetical protein TNCV_1645061 [Trichonephila clavipes]
MSKSLAPASQRIRDAGRIGIGCRLFNSLWKVRRIKGQDEVLCIQHLSIPPYRYTPNITDVLGLHVLFDFLSRHKKIRCTPPPTMEPNKGRQPAGHLTCVRHGTYLRGGTGYSSTGSCDPPVHLGH